MRIAIASDFGVSVGLWKRLMDEGNEVAVYIAPNAQAEVGKGIVSTTNSWPAILDWAKLGKDSLMLFDSSGLGKKADEARKAGIAVVGGGSFCDKLEKDRDFGFEIATQAGCLIPPYESFDSFTECLEYARSMPDVPVYFKSDRYLDSDATHGTDKAKDLIKYLEYIIRVYGGHGSCMLQKKIEGVPLSTARWWNGRSWVGPYEQTIEHKKFLNGDIGPSTGCCFNAVWFLPEDDPQVAQALGWQNLTSLFRRESAPPGLYDINCLVTPEGQAYFLEWTPRLGYDSEMTSMRLFEDFGKTLQTVALGTGNLFPSSDLAYSVRMGVPPYPWEHSNPSDLKTCLNTMISGETGDLWSENFIGYELRDIGNGLQMASPEGIVGIVYADGAPLSSLHKKTMKAAKAIQAPGLSYRTDGDTVIAKDAKALKSSGYSMHKDLLQ